MANWWEIEKSKAYKRENKGDSTGPGTSDEQKKDSTLPAESFTASYNYEAYLEKVQQIKEKPISLEPTTLISSWKEKTAEIINSTLPNQMLNQNTPAKPIRIMESALDRLRGK